MPYRPKAPGKPKAKRKPIVRRKPALKRRVVQNNNKRKKQKVVYKDDIESGDLALFKYSGGAKIASNLSGAWKILKANQQNNIYYFECINRFMTPPSATLPPGNCMLGTQWTGNSVGSGSVILPLVLHSLSCTPNINNGSIANPVAQWIAQRNSSTSSLNFNTFGSWATLNTAGASGGVQSYPGQADILKSLSAKFVLYGTTTRPVKWRIDLVQFTEDYFHPDFINANNANTNQAGWTAFYEELLREYTYSPASFSDSTATKGKIKYLKSWTHLIQPRNTSEANVQENISGMMETTVPCAHSHSFNLFHKFNRAQRYNWNDNIAVPEPTGNTYDNPPSIAGDNQTDVRYRARIYLMIRALAPSPTINGQWEATVTPSYDMSLRTYHTNLG